MTCVLMLEEILCVCFSLTLEAVNSKSFRRVWISSLVFIFVECADPKQASSTLRPGDGDRVSNAAVGKPAVVTAVQTSPPRGEQLTGRGQDSVVLLTLLSRLLEGEFVAERRRIEDLSFRWRTDTEDKLRGYDLAFCKCHRNDSSSDQ